MMAVLPAEIALEAAQKMRDAYNLQMGKVANRLGLDISIVWAPSETPFSAILDAGRRSMRRELTAVFQPITESQIEKWPGRTEDDWYPYFQTPDGQTKHVRDCLPNESVLWEPSTFDFEFLDAAARRFELAYHPQTHARRGAAVAHRPYPLEMLETFETTRFILHRCLALGSPAAKISQLKNLDGLLHHKRELWQCNSWNDLDPTFISWTLCNVEWGKTAPTPAEINTLIQSVRSGVFADVLEIELGIRKAGRRHEAPSPGEVA